MSQKRMCTRRNCPPRGPSNNQKHGFNETALWAVALMGVSARSTKCEDGRFIIGIGAHTNEMSAACNHCRYGV
eukprot:7251012-Prymnesium_polylepis.1